MTKLSFNTIANDFAGSEAKLFACIKAVENSKPGSQTHARALKALAIAEKRYIKLRKLYRDAQAVGGTRNPHRSHARVSAARSAATTKIFNEVARINKLAREAEKAGLRGVAKELGAKATRLLKRANKSGGQEGPVGRLPNPNVEWFAFRVDASNDPRVIGTWIAEKVTDNKVVSRARFKTEKAARSFIAKQRSKKKNPIRLTAADIARLPQKAQAQIKRELERDEPPIIRRPLRAPSFDSMPLLSQIPSGASKARLKSGQVISRVKGLNPRAKNFGLIDLAGGLQAEDYLEKRLLGRKKRNPSVSDLSKTFQGKATGAVSSFKASNSAPSDLARIGKLVFIKLAGNRKQTRVPGAMVAVDTKGKLWIVGNRTPLFARKAKPGEALDFGDVNQICYATAKKHIEAGKLTEYVHSFGEEGGRKPRLLIDSEGMPILRGGDYQIKSEGIIN